MRQRLTILELFLISVLFLPIAKADQLFGTDTLTRPSRTYDVLHYKIEVRFEEEKKKVIGSTTISFVPLRSKLDSVAFHAVELDVQSVSFAGGKDLRFSNDRKALTVYLGASFGFDDTLHINVNYSTVPSQGLYFISPDSTNPKRHSQIWSQGEDIDNRHWFPCWDFPNDKATSEVIGTVHESWTLLSNGKLVGVTHDKKDRTKRYHWFQAKPHASYLVMMVAGEYTIVSEMYRNIPIEYYLYNERADDGKRSLSATPEILKYLEEATGFAYPWEKFAQIFIDDFMWGGMENTSAVTLNTSYLLDRRALLDFTSDDVVAHELAHQWFGDLVTSRDWTELWLNEGFANYFEALYKKQAKGPDESQLDLSGQASAVIGVERAQGRKPLVSNDSYTANLYSKGAWVLYMLHTIVGETEFFRAIKSYLHRNAFTSVCTADLQKALEETTGRNLDWFFSQWVYKAGHPQLNVSSSWDDSTHQLVLTIQQTQTLDSLTGVFVFPLDIECTTTTGRTTKQFWLTKQAEEVRIPLHEKPLMVIVDKGMKLLKTLKFEKSKDEWVYQLLHAEDIVDRMSAAKSLKEYAEDAIVFFALKQAALNDPFWAVRRDAAMYLGTHKHPDVKGAMFEICKDKKSAVRNAAVVALEQFQTKEVADFLYHTLANDSSYLVQSSCLQALVQVDSVNAFATAAKYSDHESYRDIVRRSALQALRTLGSRDAIPVALRYARIGNPPDIRSLALGILRDVGEEDTASRLFVLKLTNDPNATVRKGAIRTLAQWGGDDSVAALQSRKSVEGDEEVRKEIQLAIDQLSEK
jgi:aminopeptidase N